MTPSNTTIQIEDDDRIFKVVHWTNSLLKEEEQSNSNSATLPKQTLCHMLLSHEGDSGLLIQWMSDDRYKKRNVFLRIDPAQSVKQERVIELVDVQCIGYENTQEGLEIELLVGGIKQGQVALESHWKTTPFVAERTAPTDSREVAEESTVFSDGNTDDKDMPQTSPKSSKFGKLKQPKSIIDVPKTAKPTDTSGIIYPNAPKGKMPKIPKVPEMPKKMPSGIKKPKDIFKIPDGPIDVDTKGIHKKMEQNGVIFPNKPNTPKLSDAAKQHIPKNMQGVITDHPEDVLKNPKAEEMRQDIVIAATNPNEGKFMNKALKAGKKLVAIGIPAIAIAGTVYSTVKSGKKTVKDIKKAGKWLKKRF